VTSRHNWLAYPQSLGANPFFTKMNTRTHKCPKSSTNGNHIFEYYYDDNDNFIGDAEDCKLCGIGYGYDIDRGFVEVK